MAPEKTPEEKLAETLSRGYSGPPGDPIPCRILLSGAPNAGTSTLRTKLASFLGFKEFYVGDVFREMAREKGLSIGAFYASVDTETEMAIDRKWITEQLLKHPWIVMEGRMAPWVERVASVLGLTLQDWKHAQNIKLLLTVDSREGGLRALKRTENEGKTLTQVTQETEKRLEAERTHYESLYDTPNYLDESHFDIIIDTSCKTPDEVFKEARAEIWDYIRKHFSEMF